MKPMRTMNHALQVPSRVEFAPVREAGPLRLCLSATYIPGRLTLSPETGVKRGLGPRGH